MRARVIASLILAAFMMLGGGLYLRMTGPVATSELGIQAVVPVYGTILYHEDGFQNPIRIALVDSLTTSLFRSPDNILSVELRGPEGSLSASDWAWQPDHRQDEVPILRRIELHLPRPEHPLTVSFIEFRFANGSVKEMPLGALRFTHSAPIHSPWAFGLWTSYSPSLLTDATTGRSFLEFSFDVTPPAPDSTFLLESVDLGLDTVAYDVTAVRQVRNVAAARAALSAGQSIDEFTCDSPGLPLPIRLFPEPRQSNMTVTALIPLTLAEALQDYL